MNRFFKSSMVLIFAAMQVSLCSLVSADDYYKWIDENGNLHFSDSLANVPEQYRKRVENKRYENDGPASSKPLVNTPPGRSVENAPSAKIPSTEGKKEAKKYEVPYRAYEGSAKRVIIYATFNGSVTAPLAIDTGAPGTIISTPLARKLGLFDEEHGRLLISTGGIGGTAPAVRTIIDTIEVGGAKSFFVPATIIAPISDSFDGLLGMDFVSNYAITIDSKRSMVVFEELPVDPEHPGGHDQEWWTSLFSEFASARADWKAYSGRLDDQIRHSMRSIGNKDMDRKKFADEQYQEADKLFDKLDRYARENSVPMHWKQY